MSKNLNIMENDKKEFTLSISLYLLSIDVDNKPSCFWVKIAMTIENNELIMIGVSSKGKIINLLCIA